MRDFLLGILVAVGLFLIWKKEHTSLTRTVPLNTGGATAVSTCSGCSHAGAPSFSAAPEPMPGLPLISPTTVAPMASAALAPPARQILPPKPPIRATTPTASYADNGFVAHYRSLGSQVN